MQQYISLMLNINGKLYVQSVYNTKVGKTMFYKHCNNTDNNFPKFNSIYNLAIKSQPQFIIFN